MKKIVIIALSVLGVVGFGLYRHYVPLAESCECLGFGEKENAAPSFLYKIISTEDWNMSNDQDSIKVSPMDESFIHLATDKQVDKIIEKFWAQESEVVVLKLDVTQLPGELKYEQNPGGSNKYYHLYSGSIPRSSIVAVEIRKV
jgi:uncharacterized protein (DUF952 family)